MVSAIEGLLLAEAVDGYSDSEARVCMVSPDCSPSQPDLTPPQLSSYKAGQNGDCGQLQYLPMRLHHICCLSYQESLLL